MVADAGLEAFRWCQIHILGIGYCRSIYYIIIGESLVEMFLDLGCPDAVAVALHCDGLAEDLACQQHLLSLRGLESEDDTVVQIFW